MKIENKLVRGIAVGIVAGIVGTAVKTIWEHYYPVRDEDTAPPPEKLADKVSLNITGEKVDKENRNAITEVIHWVFGTVSGLVSSLLADKFSIARAAFGLPLASTFWAATHGSVVPALGLEKPVTDVKPEYARNEFLGHLVYGIAINLARKGLLRLFR